MSRFGLTDLDISNIRNVFERFPAIEEVILFGSRAMGTYKTGSDVDLSVIAPEFALQNMFALEHKLDELNLPYTFDLVLSHQISNEDVRNHIARVGVQFFKRTRSSGSLS